MKSVCNIFGTVISDVKVTEVDKGKNSFISKEFWVEEDRNSYVKFPSVYRIQFAAHYGDTIVDGKNLKGKKVSIFGHLFGRANKNKDGTVYERVFIRGERLIILSEEAEPVNPDEEIIDNALSEATEEDDDFPLAY